MRYLRLVRRHPRAVALTLAPYLWVLAGLLLTEWLFGHDGSAAYGLGVFFAATAILFVRLGPQPTIT